MTLTKPTYSEKQKLFISQVQSGKNIFLTGKAGTGKSYIVKEAIKLLRLQNKQVLAIATTGIAAHNINGQTVHSVFNLDPFGILEFDACRFLKGEKRRMLNLVDTIIIDEVSMLRPDVLDAIHWTLVKNGCDGLKEKQIIFVGDMKQLPSPLNDNTLSVLLHKYNDIEFWNAYIYNKLNVIDVELDEILRQSDTEFIHHLNIVREGSKSEYFKRFLNKEPKGIVLAPHNSTVAKYNKAGLDSIESKLYAFEARVTGNINADDFGLETRVTVKHGCKIMYLVNSKNNNLVNGTLGIFEVIEAIEGTNERDQYFINVGGVRYALESHEFTKKEYVLNARKDALELQEIGSICQMPIKLAYALTIHKSQGLTFEHVTIDLSQPCFSKGQLYTALSRVTSPDGLTIIVNR
jgi:ATP-dependent DNA helicase PIF1